jgi:hypothetical protein
VHNGVPDKFGVADNEVKDSDPAGAASVEGGGVSPQRFDQAGDLLGKFRYRDVIRSLNVASGETGGIEGQYREVIGQLSRHLLERCAIPFARWHQHNRWAITSLFAVPVDASHLVLKSLHGHVYTPALSREGQPIFAGRMIHIMRAFR